MAARPSAPIRPPAAADRGAVTGEPAPPAANLTLDAAASEAVAEAEDVSEGEEDEEDEEDEEAPLARVKLLTAVDTLVVLNIKDEN